MMHLIPDSPMISMVTTGQTLDTMAALSKLVERAEHTEYSDRGPVFVVTLIIILFMAIYILSSIIYVLTTPRARKFMPEWRVRPGARPYRTARALEEAVPLTRPEPVVAGPSSRNQVSSTRRPKARNSDALPRIHSTRARVGSSRRPRPADQFEEIELSEMKPVHMV